MELRFSGATVSKSPQRSKRLRGGLRRTLSTI